MAGAVDTTILREAVIYLAVAAVITILALWGLGRVAPEKRP